jgi:signal transduction histidine kinase
LSSLTIYTEISQNAKTLIFEDNGIGFDMKEVKGRIFELNQTFHNHADSKGIGLYLVKKHLRSVGAKIEVESQLTKGTKFIITFKK